MHLKSLVLVHRTVRGTTLYCLETVLKLAGCSPISRLLKVRVASAKYFFTFDLDTTYLLFNSYCSSGTF